MQQRSRWSRAVTLVLGLAAIAPSAGASASPGFYVARDGTRRDPPASVVVVMRDEADTVLVIRPDYDGPAQDLALVIPVFGEIATGGVGFVAPELFERVDETTAPRLIERWERDPCAPAQAEAAGTSSAGRVLGGVYGQYELSIADPVERGPYELEVVPDAAALSSWLRERGYASTASAEPLLPPALARAEPSFVVAEVDANTLAADARAEARPAAVRVHYLAERLLLPLGGPSRIDDRALVVLSPHARHEVVTRPGLVLPEAVVTEFVADATDCARLSCSTLSESELAALGADVLPRYAAIVSAFREGRGWAAPGARPFADEFTLTRMRVRQEPGAEAELLELRELPGSSAGASEPFVTRELIDHEWTGAITCEEPVRGRWRAEPPIAWARESPAEVDEAAKPDDESVRPSRRGCACEAGGGDLAADLSWLALILALVLARRVRTSNQAAPSSSASPGSSSPRARIR